MIGIVEKTTRENTAEPRSLEGRSVGCNGSEDAKGNDDGRRVVGIAVEPEYILAKEPMDDGEDDVVAQSIDAKAAEDTGASVANKCR